MMSYRRIWNAARPALKSAAGAAALLLGGQAAGQTPAGEQILFKTGFEAAEGYKANEDLVASDGTSQNGWTSFGYAGNGILADPVPGFTGQYAYIGFAAPPNLSAPFSLWHPVDFLPQPASMPVAVFRVSFEIFGSTTNAPSRDDFRWSVYTTESHRLFSLDFDEQTQLVEFALDDNQGFVTTGYTFNEDTPYDLEIWMDYARNLWTARINGAVVANSLPMTTQNAKLDFGDADAVWAFNDPRSPGDNYMIFDDYFAAAEPVSDIPPKVAASGFLLDGSFGISVLGESGITYAVDGTSDFVHWGEVGRGVAPSPVGMVQIIDHSAQTTGSRFYRARSITP